MARTLFEHPVLTLEGFDVETRHGTAEYIRIRMPDWVNVVAITTDGRVVLVRQHRWGIDASTLEIPGGCVDPGESPLAAGQRELREETGYGGGAWRLLGSVTSNPAIQDNRTWLYVAEGVVPVGAPEPDPGESIAIEHAPTTAIAEMVASGAIHHALAVVSLLWWLRDLE